MLSVTKLPWGQMHSSDDNALVQNCIYCMGFRTLWSGLHHKLRALNAFQPSIFLQFQELQKLILLFLSHVKYFSLILLKDESFRFPYVQRQQRRNVFKGNLESFYLSLLITCQSRFHSTFKQIKQSYVIYTITLFYFHLDRSLASSYNSLSHLTPYD